MLTY
jgi:tetratricopeptide (TPR) repeat protein